MGKEFNKQSHLDVDLVLLFFSSVTCMSLGYFWIKFQRPFDAECSKILKFALFTAVENQVFVTHVSLKKHLKRARYPAIEATELVCCAT